MGELPFFSTIITQGLITGLLKRVPPNEGSTVLTQDTQWHQADQLGIYNHAQSEEFIMGALKATL